jgi:hypothetical protein
MPTIAQPKPAAKAAAPKAEAPAFKLPKTLAACADMLYTLERERYVLQHKIEAMKKQESALTEHLIENLPRSDALGITGKIARATIKDREIVELVGTEADRFEKLYDYVLKNAKKNPGVWALLQRRVGEGAAKEMIAAGKGGLIGAKLGTVKVISLSKVS